MTKVALNPTALLLPTVTVTRRIFMSLAFKADGRLNFIFTRRFHNTKKLTRLFRRFGMSGDAACVECKYVNYYILY